MANAKRLMSLALCGLVMVFTMGADSCGGGKTVDITILHTNDLHSHFRAEPSTSEKNPYALGGYARIKTLIDRLKGQLGNTIVLDAGDWSEATTHHLVDAGAGQLKLMDAMGYNAAVVGNHDFLNGPTVLANTIESAAVSFPVLGANKDLSAVPSPERERVAKAVPDYVIFERGGVKIGVIGVLCNDFFYFGYFAPGVVTNPIERASAIARKLHDEKLADVIILLSHNTFDWNVGWAKNVPWVNAIISGHAHKKVTKAVETTNAGRPAYIVETGQWGQYLGQLTLTVNKEENRATLKEYKLHPVTSDIPEDPGVVALVDEQDRKLAARFGKDIVNDHVADSDDEMVHDDYREVPIANMAADGYREAVGTDVALESVQLINDGIGPGKLSTWNVMNITPHIFHPIPGKPFPEFGRSWTVHRLHLKGVTLRGLLNMGFLIEAADLMGKIALSGAQVTYGGGASAVETLRVLNPATGEYEFVVDERVYTVAIHDGLLHALNIIKEKIGLDIDLGNAEDSGIETWQATLAHVIRKGRLRAADYEAGTRYRSIGADLGFYEHSIKLRTQTTPTKGAFLEVAIQNEGLVSTQTGAFKLRVRRGDAGDVLGDLMLPEGLKAAVSADVAVPALQPGARTIVEVPWTNQNGPGKYWLNFELIGTDTNPKNNFVNVHRSL